MADPKTYKIKVTCDQGIQWGEISIVTIDKLGHGTKTQITMPEAEVELEENTEFIVVPTPKVNTTEDPSIETPYDRMGVLDGFYRKIRNRKYDFQPVDPITGEDNPEFTFETAGAGDTVVWYEAIPANAGQDYKLVPHTEEKSMARYASCDEEIIVRFEEEPRLVNKASVKKDDPANRYSTEDLNKKKDYKYILQSLSATTSKINCVIEKVPELGKDPQTGEVIYATAWDEKGQPKYGFTMVRAICLDPTQGRCLEVIFGDKSKISGSDTGKAVTFNLDEVHQLQSGKWQVSVSVDNGWDVSTITQVVTI